jgi:ornithine decarboxylase
VCADIRKALTDLVPSDIRIIAEPGRFLASTAFTLACKVIGKRRSGSLGAKEHSSDGMLYLGGGVYGDFMNVVMEKLNAQGYLIKQPGATSTQHGAEPHRYSMWGPTCDSLDKISDDCEFREDVELDDWVCFPSRGGHNQAKSSNSKILLD